MPVHSKFSSLPFSAPHARQVESSSNLKGQHAAEKVIFPKLLKKGPASAEAASRRQADAS